MTRTGTVRRIRRYSYYTCAGFHSTCRPECKGRHIRMEHLDEVVLGAVRDRLLDPLQLEKTLATLSARHAEKSDDTKQRLLVLENAAAKAKAKLDRLYKLVEAGVQEIDDVLRDRLTNLRAERERLLADLKRARANVLPSVAIDAEKIEKFSRLVNQKLATGDVNMQKAYLRSFIDAVEVGNKRVRIIGRRTTLHSLVTGSSASSAIVRGLMRKWRSQGDSNPCYPRERRVSWASRRWERLAREAARGRKAVAIRNSRAYRKGNSGRTCNWCPAQRDEDVT